MPGQPARVRPAGGGHPDRPAPDRLRPAAVRGRRQPGRGAAVGRSRRGRSCSSCTSSRRCWPASPASSSSGLTNTASVSLADSLVLPSVAAAVIGGTSILGGRGGYGGTIVGALILTVLTAAPDGRWAARGGPPDPVRRDHRGRRGRLHPGHRRDLIAVSDGPPTRRHLGLDLGVTNLKWAVVEHDGGDWRTLDRGQVPTPAADGPDAVVGAARGGRRARRSSAGRRSRSLGIGVPGLYDPATGCDPVPRQHARATGRVGRSRAPVGGGARLPGRADQRRAGVRAGGAAARRGARRALDGRADPGHRASAASSPSTAGSTSATTGRPARSATRPSTRTGRRAAAATTAASRRSPGRTGSRRRAGRRRPRPRSRRPAPATRGRSPGWPRSGATSASASPT